jgi:hypothetical protein
MALASALAAPGPTVAIAVGAHVEDDAKQVRITMINSSTSNASDASFHLVVFCHR